MIDFRPRPAEASAVVSAIGAVLIAALFNQVEWLRFGTFPQMLGAFLVADVLTYLAVKLGWIKRRNRGNRS